MSPEFEQEGGSYGISPQLRRHGRVPSWGDEQQSHGRWVHLAVRLIYLVNVSIQYICSS